MPAESVWDKRNFLPHQELQDNILPCDPLFTRLLSLAHKPQQRPVIRDLRTGIERTSAELLSDAIHLRTVLRSQLSAQTLQELRDGKEVFISLLAPGGHEFTVGILAILGLGAACSPLTPQQPVNEAEYYVNKARSVAVLASTSAVKLGQELAAQIIATTNPDFVCVPVSAGLKNDVTPASQFVIASSGYRDINSAGIVIFTSGTTGPPKGAVLPLAAITDGAISFADQLRLRDTDTLQHLLPVHHATGIWVSFFPFLLSGACIEFRSGSFDPRWTWERWRRGGITHFTGVPTIYMRLMRYYQETLAKLPPTELAPYTSAPSRFCVCMCGTSALPKPTDDFWTSLLDGKRIIQRYGSTEQGVVFHMPLDRTGEIPDGSVGEVTPGVEVRLSAGDEGEILTRSFNMFSKYLHDPAATRAAHDGDGYFRSGDIARRQGRHYFIVGRASVDIVKSGGYKISALDVERALLALPYAAEVMVVGVPDDEFGQRVGAVLSLRTDEIARAFCEARGRSPGTLDIDDLRADLRDGLAGYKLPTLLRVIKGELPKSATSKVVKKTLGPLYFPPDYVSDPEVQVWRRQDGKARETKL